ncbi:MAG TPA: YHS domain-containing protein [Ignavibacteriaceae bacterium]|nr:YHS domain-containing protein [Ignavibacteriaceae bacterium]
MKTSLSIKSLLLITAISLFFLSAGYAQDKKDDSCCTSGKMMQKMDHSKMDHSKMDQSNCDKNKMSIETYKDSTETTDLKAEEVDSKLAAWNELCPVRGEKIDTEASKVSYNNKVYGFCCNGCDSKFMKDPEKYSKNLSEDGKAFLGTK